MSFRLKDEARKYFKKIDDSSGTGTFENIWDYYYVCLMVGFRNGKLGEESSETTEFHKDFPRVYNLKKYRIIASLILAEALRQGINIENTEEIREIMLDLLDKDSITKVSKEGLKLMNMYADGGFELINERIPQPLEMDEFLLKYYEEFIEIDEGN